MASRDVIRLSVQAASCYLSLYSLYGFKGCQNETGSFDISPRLNLSPSPGRVPVKLRFAMHTEMLSPASAAAVVGTVEDETRKGLCCKRGGCRGVSKAKCHLSAIGAGWGGETPPHSCLRNLCFSSDPALQGWKCIQQRSFAIKMIPSGRSIRKGCWTRQVLLGFPGHMEVWSGNSFLNMHPCYEYRKYYLYKNRKKNISINKISEIFSDVLHWNTAAFPNTNMNVAKSRWQLFVHSFSPFFSRFLTIFRFK